MSEMTDELRVARLRIAELEQRVDELQRVHDAIGTPHVLGLIELGLATQRRASRRARARLARAALAEVEQERDRLRSVPGKEDAR